MTETAAATEPPPPAVPPPAAATGTGAGRSPAATPADRAAVLSASGFAATLIWQLALSRGLLQAVGEEAFGLWATIGAFKAFVVFLDGGLAQGVVRAAGFAGDGGAARRIRAFWRIEAVIAAVAVALAALASPWAAGYLDLAGPLADLAPWLVLAHGADAALALLGGPLPAILRGRRLFAAVAAMNVGQAAAGLLLLAVLLPAHGAVGAVAAVVLARTLTIVATAAWMARRHLLPRVAAAAPPVAARAVLASVLPVWAIVAANQIAMRADVPIVGRWFGAVAAGHYELGQQLPTAAMSLLGAVMAFALPQFVADERHGGAAQLHRRLPRVVFMACLLAALGFGALAALAPELLQLWVGTAPATAVTVARLYAAAWACNAAVLVLVQVAVARDRFGVLLWPTLLGSLLNFALSLWLAAAGRVDGPALATLLTMGVWDLVVVPALLLAHLRLPVAATVRAALLGFGSGGIAALAIAAVVAGCTRSPWSAVALGVLLVAAVAAIALDCTVRRRSVVLGVWRRVGAARR